MNSSVCVLHLCQTTGTDSAGSGCVSTPNGRKEDLLELVTNEGKFIHVYYMYVYINKNINIYEHHSYNHKWSV